MSLTDASVEQDPTPVQFFMSGLVCMRSIQYFRNARSIEPLG